MNIDAYHPAQLTAVRRACSTILMLAACCLANRQAAFAQRAHPAPRDTADAKRDTAKKPAWRFVHANELETPFMTIRLGAAALIEQDWYAQDETSRAQVEQIRGGPPAPFQPPDRPHTDAPSLRATVHAQPTATAARAQEPGELERGFKFRDTRFMFNGRIKTERPITWSAGFMWDGTAREWFVRQTGIVVAVPEMWGHLWVGRSKEGVSLNRVMVGYDGWTMERFTFSDAAIPLLADGIRWMGYLPRQRLIWNLGVFSDVLSKGQTFSYYEQQVAGRVAYLHMDADTSNVLHAGIAFRLGHPTNDTLQLRSKPESTTAPNFVDTGKFRAPSAQLVGVEAFYRPGSWLFGGEYYLQKAESAEAGDPIFHGGDIFTSWLVTGEKRAYTTVGGYFRSVAPAHPVFEGGWGALELVLRGSYIDLTSGALTGGTFWRITPTINWHLNRNFRLEIGYGYGVLDRFGMKGATHFFQTRLQSQL